MRRLTAIGVGAAFLVALCAVPAMADTSLAVTAGCALNASNFGLEVTHDGTNTNAFLIDDSPTNETRHIVKVFSKLTAGYTMTNGDTHQMIRARDPGGSGTIWRAQVRRRPDGQFTMVMWHNLDVGSEFVGEVFFTPNANQCFQFDWQASSSAGAGDGQASIKKCAGLPKSKTNRDNFFVVNQQQLGSFAGIDPGTSGVICHDDYESRRAP